MHYIHVLCLITAILEKMVGNFMTYNYCIFSTLRRVWRYQMGNRNRQIKEEQTAQWPKEKGQKDKQRSTKHNTYAMCYPDTENVNVLEFKLNIIIFHSANVLQRLFLSNRKIQIQLHRTCTYMISMKGHRRNIIPNSIHRKDQSSIWARTKSDLWWCCAVVLPEVTWPEVTSVTWPEVALTGSHVTESAHYRKYVLPMHNRKLRNIIPSRTFWPEVTSSNVTWPLWVSLGRMGCAHAQPEVAQYPP